MSKRLFLCGILLFSPVHAQVSPCNPANLTVGYFSEGPCEYEPYPGTAYENSFTTAQIVTAVGVSVAVIALIAIALTNTPGGNSHQCH